jgi:outer membrane protein OmpA-like peptidoglycan-associated protein
MKKILVMLMVALFATMSMNAQKALVEQKFWDNWYIGINGGATTPLSFDEVFPVNPTVGLRVGKDFTPVFGVNIEGTGWLGSHVTWDAVKRFDIIDPNSDHFAFRSTNVGVNGTVNFTNLFHGYNGKPRVFEVVGLVGAGWWHTFRKDAADNNDLSAKTALDFTFNLGSKRAHSIYIEPAVTWNLGSAPREIQFNKNYAQFGLSLGYNYHFKTSNGEHYFVEYDIDALNEEINMRRSQEPQVVEKVVERVVEKVVEVPVVKNRGEVIVSFAKGSSKLTNTAKDLLNQIEKGATVEVVATASPEGTDAKNSQISQERADAVSQYLMKRGVKVRDSRGLGATGEDSQRIARVILQ